MRYAAYMEEQGGHRPEAPNVVPSDPAYDQPWEAFLNFIEEVESVHWLTKNALNNLQGMGRLAEVIHGKKGAEWKGHIDAAHQLEKAAFAEVERGMPLHISHSAVAVCTALESTIPEFLALWLCANKHFLGSQRFSKIRIPASMLVAANERELMLETLAELSRSTPSAMRAGIGRFEVILECCGLSGGLDEPSRRDLFELSQVRNLVVHRFGIADERFVASCPWLALSPGERLVLSEDTLFRYSKAARNYAANIVERALAASSKTDA